MFYSSSLIYPPTLLRRCIASSDNRSQCKDISGRPYLKQLVALRLEDMKASSGALLAAVAFAAVAATAVATTYTVGGTDQWDTYIDYDKWTAGKTFMVGDTIGACLLAMYSVPSMLIYRSTSGSSCATR